mgnify:CR=1 FL=1
MSGLLLGANQYSRVFIPGARVLGTGCQGTELCCIGPSISDCDGSPVTNPTKMYITVSGLDTSKRFRTLPDPNVDGAVAYHFIDHGLWENRTYSLVRDGEPFVSGTSTTQTYVMPGPFYKLPGCASAGYNENWHFHCTKKFFVTVCDPFDPTSCAKKHMVVDYYYSLYMLKQNCVPDGTGNKVPVYFIWSDYRALTRRVSYTDITGPIPLDGSIPGVPPPGNQFCDVFIPPVSNDFVVAGTIYQDTLSTIPNDYYWSVAPGPFVTDTGTLIVTE